VDSILDARTHMNMTGLVPDQTLLPANNHGADVRHKPEVRQLPYAYQVRACIHLLNSSFSQHSLDLFGISRNPLEVQSWERNFEQAPPNS
jgi:hypothetical protein